MIHSSIAVTQDIIILLNLVGYLFTPQRKAKDSSQEAQLIERLVDCVSDNAISPHDCSVKLQNTRS